MNKGKIKFLVVMAIFILPVILAKFALETDFFNRGSTNQGQLISPPLSIATLPLSEEQKQKWLLIYPLAQQCDNKCENAQYAVNQVRTALGREMDRVEVVLLQQNQGTSADITKEVLMLSEENIKEVFQQLPIDGIFIADPLGNIMMRYDIEADKQNMIMRSREILSDLKKLLKLSRIG